jgi:hypothetical protein
LVEWIIYDTIRSFFLCSGKYIYISVDLHFIKSWWCIYTPVSKSFTGTLLFQNKMSIVLIFFDSSYETFICFLFPDISSSYMHRKRFINYFFFFFLDLFQLQQLFGSYLLFNNCLSLFRSASTTIRWYEEGDKQCLVSRCKLTWSHRIL